MRHATFYETEILESNNLYVQDGAGLYLGLFAFDVEWHNIQAAELWAGWNTELDNAAARMRSSYVSQGSILGLRSRERLRWLEADLLASRRLRDRRTEEIHLNNLGIACNLSGSRCSALQQKQGLLVHSF